MVDSTLSPSVFDVSWEPLTSPSRFRLLVHSPTSLFCYWVLDDVRRQLLDAHFGNASMRFNGQLQLVRLQSPFADEGDVVQAWNVSNNTGSWYFRDIAPGEPYRARIVTLTADGEPFTILRTHVERTPPSLDFMAGGHPQRKPLHHRHELHTEPKAAQQRRLATENAEGRDSPQTIGFPYMDTFDGYSIIEPGGTPNG